MTQMRFLLIALRITEGSRWHDDIDQPRRHIIDESGNKPVSGQGGVRLERSNIDRNRCARVPDRFGLQFLFADSKVTRQHVWVLIEASDPALGVLKNDKVKLARRIASFTLRYPIEHPHRLHCSWSDSPTNIAYHDSLSELETEQVSRIDARINTANDQGPQGRHEG
jgi:hypothetical protein